MSEHFRKWSDTMSEHVGKIIFVSGLCSVVGSMGGSSGWGQVGYVQW